MIVENCEKVAMKIGLSVGLTGSATTRLSFFRCTELSEYSALAHAVVRKERDTQDIWYRDAALS
jgi:hypothetical protein